MNKVGVYGLGVMGQSLARNIQSKGFPVSVFNIEEAITRQFTTAYPGCDGFMDLAAFVNSLETPRKILLMVTAGKVVDTVIASLLPYLEKGDILIDCGNSYYQDSERRMRELDEKGIRFLGSGVSGGEKGALYGPSIMPSGAHSAYQEVEELLMAMAAHNADGSACCTYIGNQGAGHFVKMVHNGIEYADMQLIAEVYGILRYAYHGDMENIYAAFKDLQEGSLHSYLLSITLDILSKQEAGEYLLTKVLDVAKQKGTGKWTALTSLEYDVPVPSLLEAIEARFLSAMKQERVLAEQLYTKADAMDAREPIDLTALKQAMYCAKASIYAQGFSLIEKVNKKRAYGIDLKQLAIIWQNGCIIKSAFLKDIYEAYKQTPELTNLLMAQPFQTRIADALPALVQIISYAQKKGRYIPVLSSALNYIQGYTSAELETNLIQAQRDCFGAHTYERTDKEGIFHSEWQK